MTAVAMILGFQLFILTDYIGLGAVEAKEVLVIAGLLIGTLALAAESRSCWPPFSWPAGR